MDRQSVAESRRRTVRELLGGRPWWINLLWMFCLYMTFIYMPFDFFLKPTAEDREVWFGVALTGFWAKATEPFHWAIYALGAWGFWGMRPWMWPWAAVVLGAGRHWHVGVEPARCSRPWLAGGRNRRADLHGAHCRAMARETAVR